MAATGSFTTSCWRKYVSCRRMWIKSEEDVLVEALKEILTTGWKADNRFHMGYLNVLQDKRVVIIERMPIRKDRANGNGAEDFYDAFVGVVHTKPQSQSSQEINLEDTDTPYTLMVDEVSKIPVVEFASSTTTKQSSKGKHKRSDGIIDPIMDGLNNFTDKTDLRLGDIIGKMGHEHELTRKCKSVYHIVNQIADLTLDEKHVETNMIVKNTLVLTTYLVSPRKLKLAK
ncbi:hypothetical protein BUALT_Bualt08G0007000 [Buddleja alternifolia]|uniref:Uncharacterized protein n=1 Tax=Buddleja alternifolia TaxID=168488 RepID=A0AAV6X444_9LAMI|nr:hypothetical protein BUALT_Bualt08G0007000 [Buddleja alternifolia]